MLLFLRGGGSTLSLIGNESQRTLLLVGWYLADLHFKPVWHLYKKKSKVFQSCRGSFCHHSRACAHLFPWFYCTVVGCSEPYKG